MKVTWVSDTFEQLNGVAVYIKNIMPLLQGRVEADLLTGRVKGAYQFPIKSLPSVPVPLLKDYDIILPTFTKLPADILHVHTAYSLGFYASLLGNKKVVTTHLHPYHLLEGVFGHNQPKVMQKLAWSYVVSFFNRFDVVICQTNATKELYKEKGLSARAEVVPNGMRTTEESIENFKPTQSFKEKYGIKDDFAFFLGRLDASKRIDWVVEVAKKLPEREFVVVGKGTLEKKIPKLGNLHVFNYLPHDDKQMAFYESAMLLMPSCVETEGIVAQEAMLFKKPVLISDNPVLEEVVGRGGLSCKSSEELAEKTEYLFNNPRVRKELGEKAFTEVKKRDVNASVNKLVRIYESLM